MSKQTRVGTAIPSNIDAPLRCVGLMWPQGEEWDTLLRSMLYMLTRGRFWDANSGTVTDAQRAGWSLFDANTPLAGCDGEPIPTPEPEIIYKYIGGGAAWEEEEMPCLDLTNLIKLERGHLYVRDSCCEWHDLGALELPTDYTGDTPGDALPVDVDWKCRKAYALGQFWAEVAGVVCSNDIVDPFTFNAAMKSQMPYADWTYGDVMSIWEIVTAFSALVPGYPLAWTAEDTETFICRAAQFLSDTPDDLSNTEFVQCLGAVVSMKGAILGAMWSDIFFVAEKKRANRVIHMGLWDAEATCACPETAGFGQTEPSVDGWYLSPYFDVQEFDGGAEIFPAVALPSGHDVFGWVGQYLTSNGGEQYAPTVTLFHTDAPEAENLWDVDASAIAQNTIHAYGISQAAFDQVLGAGSYNLLTGGGQDWGAVATPTHPGPESALSLQLHQQGGSVGSYSRWYGFRLLYNVNSPSHS